MSAAEGWQTRIEGGIEFYAVKYDGREEEEVQCARCGSSAGWVVCWDCGGLGGHDVDDPDWDADEVWETCETCHGKTGEHHCLSSPEWCEAHPLPGRESIESTALKPEAWND